MKKAYMKPVMREVKVQQQRMLCGSPYDDVKSPLDIFDGQDDEEDIITDMDEIW